MSRAPSGIGSQPNARLLAGAGGSTTAWCGAPSPALEPVGWTGAAGTKPGSSLSSALGKDTFSSNPEAAGRFMDLDLPWPLLAWPASEAPFFPFPFSGFDLAAVAVTVTLAGARFAQAKSCCETAFTFGGSGWDDLAPCNVHVMQGGCHWSLHPSWFKVTNLRRYALASCIFQGGWPTLKAVVLNFLACCSLKLRRPQMCRGPLPSGVKLGQHLMGRDNLGQL